MSEEIRMLRLEHVGIAVEDVEAARGVFEALFRRRVYRREEVASEGVATHFLEAGPVKLEFLEALGSDSALARSLRERGPGLHHLAFEVTDLGGAHALLREAGFRPLGDPGAGADGKRVFFLHPKETARILIELCATGSDAGFACPGEGPPGEPSFRLAGTGPEAAELSRALARRFVVAGDGKADVVVLFRPDRIGAHPSPVVLVDPDPRCGPCAGRSLTIAIREDLHHASVRIPAPIFAGLPDPWTLVADLIVAFART